MNKLLFILFAIFISDVAQSETVVRETDKSIFTKHDVLGRRLKANVKGTDKAFFNDQLLFSVKLETDQFGRRKTYPKPKSDHNQALVFLGDSCTMGVGVHDYETLPSQLAQLTPKHNVYNYAVGGWGPTHSLIDLRLRDLKKEIPEQTSRAFYIHYDFLVYRSIPKLASLNWNRNTPYLAKNGELSTFASQRPWLFRFLQFADSGPLSRLWPQLKNLVNRHRLSRLSTKEIQHYVYILESLLKEYENQLGGRHKLSLVLVGNTDIRLKEALMKLPSTIDFTDFDLSEEETIAHDGHPNASGHQRLAKKIHYHLNQVGELGVK